MKKILLLTIWCLTLASTSFAQSYSAGSGSGGDFGDTGGDQVIVDIVIDGADFDGLAADVITATGPCDDPSASLPPAITAPAVLGYNYEITSVTIDGLEHSWAGDLNYELTATSTGAETVVFPAVELAAGVCGSDDLEVGSYMYVAPGMGAGPLSANCANAANGVDIMPGTYDAETPLTTFNPLSCGAGMISFPLGLDLTANEDVDGDGNLDVDEDANGNGALDAGEDIDGDGNLDVMEDVNGDGTLFGSITFTLTVTDGVGGDNGSFTDVTINFAPIVPAETSVDASACCAVTCDIQCPEDITIELEPGECEEVVFYNVVLPEACGSVVVTNEFGGVAVEGGVDSSIEDNGTDVEIFSGDGQSGETSTYTFTVPACASGMVGVSFDWTYDNDNGNSFWDPFDITGPNGTVVNLNAFDGLGATGGTVAETAAPGGVYTVTATTLDGFGGGATSTLSNLSMACVIGGGYDLQPDLNTAGMPSPLSGDYLAPGTTEACYTATPSAIDPITGMVVTNPADAVSCCFDITVQDFSGALSTALACNDQVNISLDENCQVVLGADMFLEGGPYGCYNTYDVSVLPFGNEPALAITAGVALTLPKGDHTYMVTDTSGNTCWGNFLVEDKIAPEFPVSDFSVTCVEDVPELLVSEFNSSFVEILDAPLGVGLNGATSTDTFTFDFPCLDAGCTVSDLNVYVNLVHTWIGDLDIIIVAPDGTQNDMIQFGGCGGQPWIIDGVFDEECAFNALTQCVDFDMGGGCFWDVGGLFGSLAGFNGVDACGEWMVIINDNVAADEGIINSIGLMFNNGDGACDIAAVTPASYLASADQCDCASFDYVDTYTTVGCEAGSIVRSWTCTDACGNTSDAAVQTITINPLGYGSLGTDWFVPPSLIELPCGTGTDPWDIANFYDDYVDIDGDMYVDVPGVPTMDCPDSDPDCPAVYEAEEGIVMGFPYYYAWGCNVPQCNSKSVNWPQPIDNNVCNLYVTYTDQVIPACENGTSTCEGNVKVIRTWTVLDWCAPNEPTIEYVQLIKSTDTTAPEISANDFAASVSPWGCVASFQFPAPEHLHDDCGTLAGYWVTGPGTIVSVNGDGEPPYAAIGVGKGMHTYTYEATDCCGNVGQTTITVTVGDNTPPTAIAEQDIVVSLTSGGYDTLGVAKIFPHNIDGGSHDGDCGPVRFEIRRMADAPDCGNIGLNGYNNNVTFNNDGSALGHGDDNNNDTDGGAYVKFCCEDLTDLTGEFPFGEHQVVLRVWDSGTDMIAGTADDNYNETWANIRVEDKLWPTIVCPPDVTVCCGADYNSLAKTGNAFATGTCSNYEVEHVDASLSGDDVCNEGTVRRTWSITGSDGHECQQFITVEWGSNWDPTWPNGGPLSTGVYPNDCIDPTLPYGPNTIDWPNDDELDCEAADDDVPTWLDANCDQIGYNLKSDTFLFEDGACMKIFNHWTIINWCVDSRFPDDAGADGIFGTADDNDWGIYTHTQILKFYDTEKPELSGEDICVAVGSAGTGSNSEDLTGCVGVATLTNAACDTLSDCMSEWIKWRIYVDVWGDWTDDYVFSSYVPSNDPNFGTPVNELYVAPTASCETVTIEIPEEIAGSKYVHRVVWKASDGCGNVTTQETFFTVEDKKAPTPYCINLSTALMQTNGEVELWACDFNAGSFDNCTTQEYLRYTFTSTPPEDDANYIADLRCSARTFTCDDLATLSNGVMELEVYVWDECGNYDFCIVNLTLSDNEGYCDDSTGGNSRIAGTISTEEGVSVENVEVLITSVQPEFPKTVITDANGQYAASNNLNNRDYSIDPSNDIEYLNGVSTIDIVIIQRHILGLGNLDSAYKMIAADVTNDQNISANDLAEIRKLILGVNTEFAHSESWRFADANQSLNVAAPFAFNELLDVIQLNGDMNNEDFVAVKMGDVNNDVDLSASTSTDNRNGSALNFVVDNASVNAGEEFTVDFTSNNFSDIYGYQFTMNTNSVDFVNVVSGAIEMTDANVAVLDNNTVTVSWNSANAVSVENEVLFSMTFEANTNIEVLDGITVSSRVTAAEAYNSDLEVMSVTFGDEDSSFALYQNEPNPFDNTTAIGFVLPSAGNATLSVYDVTGRLVMNVNTPGVKGLNTINVTKAELGTTGVLYYTLESGDFTATKKMIIIE